MGQLVHVQCAVLGALLLGACDGQLQGGPTPRNDAAVRAADARAEAGPALDSGAGRDASSAGEPGAVGPAPLPDQGPLAPSPDQGPPAPTPDQGPPAPSPDQGPPAPTPDQGPPAPSPDLGSPCVGCVVPQSWAACLSRSGATTTTITGTQSLYKDTAPPADWNLDLTNALFDGYPSATTSPVALGKSTPGARMCVGGGIVVGQQARDLTWYDMHDTIGGGGYRVTTSPGEWSRIDGIRADNVEDALKPRGPDGTWELHNAYMIYIRDDCIENDEMAPGSVHDSLFDGCYTGFSEQEQSGCCDADPGEVFVVSRSLMRLEAMPGPYGSGDPTVLGHGKWFKWQAPVPHPVEIYDSIFMTEHPPPSSSNWPFPPGTVTVNVTIVWLGPGAWSWPVPPGTTVTTDRAVWDKARQRWLDRHGCTSFNSCTKLRSPDPWP